MKNVKKKGVLNDRESMYRSQYMKFMYALVIMQGSQMLRDRITQLRHCCFRTFLLERYLLYYHSIGSSISEASCCFTASRFYSVSTLYIVLHVVHSFTLALIPALNSAIQRVRRSAQPHSEDGPLLSRILSGGCFPLLPDLNTCSFTIDSTPPLPSRNVRYYSS